MSRTLAGLFALVASLMVAACGDGTSAPQAGQFSVLLTDDPGPFAKVVIQIDRVELMGDALDECEGDEGAECVEAAEPSSRGRVVLTDEDVEVDLLTLANDIFPLAEDVVVPGGTYSEVRLIITGGCLVLNGGAVYTSPGFDPMSDEHAACEAPHGALQMPSWGQSGLKIKLPGGTVEVDGDQHGVILDFVVPESFAHQAGGSGKWVASPVIRAAGIEFAASIEVQLSDPSGLVPDSYGLDDFVVVLDGESGQPFDETGVVVLNYLVPGEHTVSVEVRSSGEGDPEPWPPFDVTISPTSEVVSLGSGGYETITFEVSPPPSQ
jgi:hypothetical protein